MRPAVFVVLAALVSSGAGVTADVEIPPLPHPPISITSDAGFTLLNGVTHGHGTPNDPYVLKGWLIVPAQIFDIVHAGIFISHTRAHVVIERNVIQLGSLGGFGILIDDAENVTIRQNAVLDNISQAIRVSHSRYVTLRENIVSNVGSGIVTTNSEHVHIADNQVTCQTDAYYAGIDLNTGSDLSATQNVVSCPGTPGINLNGVTDALVAKNLIHGSGGGIVASRSSGVQIEENRLSHNRGQGIDMPAVANLTLDGNLIEDSAAGIYLGINEGRESSETISNNAVVNSSYPLVVQGYPHPYHASFENNTIDGRPVVVLRGLANTSLDASELNAAYLLLVEFANVDVRGLRMESTTPSPVQVVNSQHVTVRSAFFHDGYGIRLVGGSENAVLDGVFVNITGPAIQVASVQNRVSNNSIESDNIGIEATWVGGITSDFLPRGERAFVSRNTIHALGSPLFVDETPGIIAENNTFSGASVVLHGASAAVLRNNNILDSPVAIRRSGWPSQDMGTVDLRQNWWGSQGGPDTRDFANATVMYSPWLRAPVEI